MLLSLDLYLQDVVIVTLGGLGSLGSVVGTIGGAFTLALVETFIYTYVGNVALLLSFVLVMVVLLARSVGLFARA